MLDAQLTMTGPQGPIRGGSGPRESLAIPVLDVRHQLVSPRDATTGLPSGKRRHAPLTIVQAVDRSTPQVLALWARNQPLTLWRLDVFGPDAFGRRGPRYSIELDQATVVEVSLSSQEAATFPQVSVGFTYQRITWTWHDGGIVEQDDWAVAT